MTETAYGIFHVPKGTTRIQFELGNTSGSRAKAIARFMDDRRGAWLTLK